MIAAIYAHKSNEQRGVNKEERRCESLRRKNGRERSRRADLCGQRDLRRGVRGAPPAVRAGIACRSARCGWVGWVVVERGSS